MPSADLAREKPPHPLSLRDYRYFWAARFFQVLAMMSMVVIIGYQVYDVARGRYGMSLKEASFQLGLVGVVQFVPLLVMAPLAGVVADRYSRRSVARLANMLDLLIALALGWLTWRDALSLPALFVLAGLHGVARSFVGPAMSALAPNLVPPASLPRAIALNSIAQQTGLVIGPAIGGFLYAQHAALPYWVSAVLMVVATIAISMVRPAPRTAERDPAHPLSQMADGFRYVRKNRFLTGAVTLDLFAVLLGGATAMLPIYARDILHVGTEGLGLMRGAPAIGSALMALWFSIRPLGRNVGVKMLFAVAAFGGFTILFGLSKSLPTAMLWLALLGAADMMSVYVRSSLVQLHTPDDMRGRVGSISQIAISASNELGETQSGFAAALLGPVGGVVFGGIGAILVTIIWAYAFPELRRAKSFAVPEDLKP